jgi:hypothetical protein
MRSLGVKGRTKTWEAHERNEQFGENESTDIGKCQRHRKQGNARIKKESAIRPGYAKKIEKVCISTYFERAETDRHIAENARCHDSTDTWTSKQVHSRSKSQRADHSTTHYGCEDALELETGVVRARLPIVLIHTRVV